MKLDLFNLLITKQSQTEDDYFVCEYDEISYKLTSNNYRILNKYIMITALFHCLLFECTQVHAHPIDKPSTLSSSSSSSSSLSLSSLNNFRCNITLFPENGGCHPFEASCDPQSQLCICTSFEQETNDSINSNRQQQQQQRHYQHKQNDVYKCLSRKKLGQSCEHSAQCYTMVTGSACYRSNRDDQWQCSCRFGQKDDEQDNCNTKTDESNFDHDKQYCDQIDGYLWIPILRKCVANRIHYSMRVGRAGGGRGGGGGGSVGRSTGSRSWFSNRRNGYRAQQQSLNHYSTTIIMATIMMMMMIIMQIA